MRRQRTIRRSVILEGKGIHAGRKVKIAVNKAAANAGINFIRTDIEEKPRIPANVSALADYSNKLRCTSLSRNGFFVHTVEHLLAALNGLSIDNADIEIDSEEPPALDGSALSYVTELKKAGSAELAAPRRELRLKEPVLEKDGGAALIALPCDTFNVSYLLHYEEANFPAQYVDFSFDTEDKKADIFAKRIAPARTFCLEKEVALIMALGLGKGAGLDNALVIKNGKPIKNNFRLQNEPACHKTLDLLGDLFLLNADIKAHIIGIKSGHFLNSKLIKKLACFAEAKKQITRV